MLNGSMSSWILALLGTKCHEGSKAWCSIIKQEMCTAQPSQSCLDSPKSDIYQFMNNGYKWAMAF